MAKKPAIIVPSSSTASVYNAIQEFEISSGKFLFSDASNNDTLSSMDILGNVNPLEGDAGASFNDVSVKNDGVLISAAAVEFNFTGDSVTASNVGSVVTVDVIETSVTEVVSNTVDFTSRKIYGVYNSPVSGTMSANLVGAKKGIIQKIYHDDSIGTLTFDPGATWILVGDGVYFNGEYNVIYAEWIGGTKIEYWILQEQ